MQFVEHQEPQALRGTDELTVVGTREQQLEHHVVGEKDVRRRAAQRLACHAFLLTSVAGKTHRSTARRISLLEELAELLVLAVGKRVHRVDDDRLNPSPRPVPQDVVHDRHDVGQTLAGARTTGQHIGPALLRLEDGLALMLVQHERLARVVGVRLVDPEDAPAVGMQHPLSDQLIDRPAGQERGVKLQQRLRPECSRRESVIHESIDLGIANPDKASRVALVVRDEPCTEVKYVHVEPPCRPSGFGRGSRPYTVQEACDLLPDANAELLIVSRASRFASAS